MIKINLLPAARQKRDLPVARIYMAIIYFILTLTLLVWVYAFGMNKYRTGQLEEVNNTIASMHIWQERFELNEAQNMDIKKRDNLINAFKKKSIVWSKNLAELGNLTPRGCWLESVVQNPQQPVNMTISGKALKMDYLLDFIYRLQNVPEVESVELVSTSMNTVSTPGSATAIDFKLDVKQRVAVSEAKK